MHCKFIPAISIGFVFYTQIIIHGQRQEKRKAEGRRTSFRLGPDLTPASGTGGGCGCGCGYGVGGPFAEPRFLERSRISRSYIRTQQVFLRLDDRCDTRQDESGNIARSSSFRRATGEEARTACERLLLRTPARGPSTPLQSSSQFQWTTWWVFCVPFSRWRSFVNLSLLLYVKCILTILSHTTLLR